MRVLSDHLKSIAESVSKYFEIEVYESENFQCSQL